MRISGGSARGRTLTAPKGVDLRPTEERVRQALFNILGVTLADGEFLDVFSGTGAVGLEALSRGASKVVFIDRESRCLKGTEIYALSFGFQPGSWEILRGTAEDCLARLARAGRTFDFIYLDPPYGTEADVEGGIGIQTLRQLSDLAILKSSDHARVIYEHARATKAPAAQGSLALLRQYPYGNSVLSLYGIKHAD